MPLLWRPKRIDRSAGNVADDSLRFEHASAGEMRNHGIDSDVMADHAEHNGGDT